MTAKDVRCTWDLLLERSDDKLRKNLRKSWYENLKEVTVDGDHQVTFHLERPQPSLLNMLAAGISPVYPCHVSARDMRVKPIGTGPFKFELLRQNEIVKLVKNEDYWKEGLPYLDGRSEERRVGKEGVRRVDLGGRRSIKKKKNNNFATLLIMSSRHTSMHDSCTFTVHEVLITTVYLLDIYAVSVYIFCY